MKNKEMNFIIKLLGKLKYNEIMGKKKLDYFRDKYMEKKYEKNNIEYKPSIETDLAIGQVKILNKNFNKRMHERQFDLYPYLRTTNIKKVLPTGRSANTGQRKAIKPMQKQELKYGILK